MRAQDLIQSAGPMPAAPPKQYSNRQHVKRMPEHVIKAEATFTNQKLLEVYVTDAGKLHPRRRTGLQAKTHRYLCRQIKVCSLVGEI